jgi:hypothetical protein
LEFLWYYSMQYAHCIFVIKSCRDALFIYYICAVTSCRICMHRLFISIDPKLLCYLSIFPARIFGILMVLFYAICSLYICVYILSRCFVHILYFCRNFLSYMHASTVHINRSKIVVRVIDLSRENLWNSYGIIQCNMLTVYL